MRRRCVTVPDIFERVFGWHARNLVQHYYLFLFGSLLVAAAMSFGWVFFSLDTDMIRTFSPMDSELSADRRMFGKFFHLNQAISLFVSIAPLDKNRNLLDQDLSKALLNLIHHVENNVTVYSPHLRRNLTYKKDFELVASPYYEANLLMVSVFEEHFLKLKYPVTSFPPPLPALPLYLPFAFGGIKYDNATSDVTSIGSMLIRYVISTPNEQRHEEALSYLHNLQHYSRRLSRSSNMPLQMAVQSMETLQEEVRKNTEYSLQYVPGAIILVLAFTVFACASLDPLKCCGMHACFGLISVVMSYTSAMGVCFMFGLKFNDLVSLTSFLALAIGVDDTFVLLSAWSEHGHMVSSAEYRPTDKYIARMTATMREAGSSITFTSITDVLAFGIGATIRVPALSDFCLFTATAIAMDYVFQITFFPAMMIVCEEFRPRTLQFRPNVQSTINKWKARILPVSAISEKPVRRTVTTTTLVGAEGSVAEDLACTTFTESISTSECHHAKISISQCNRSLPSRVIYSIVSHPIAQVSLLCLTALICAGTLWGASRAKVNMSFQKLLTDDSFIYDYVNLFDTNHWSQAIDVHCVATIPNYTNNSNIIRFLDFVAEIEQLPDSFGEAGTSLWIRDFQTISQQYLLTDVTAYFELSGRRLGVHGNHSVTIDLDNIIHVQPRAKQLQFHFTMGFRGSDSWDHRIAFLQNLTRIRGQAKYAAYDIGIFSDMSFMADMLIYTKASTRQTLGMVLVSTFVVLLLFLATKNWQIIFWTSFSFLVINSGVCGGLVWWDTDVDFVSMVTILMSVGFSVDYTVHVAFTYSRQILHPQIEDLGCPVQRTLDVVAAPVLLSGCSTLLAVSLVSFVHSYMIRTFLKTVLLVVVLGLLQSLLVLPILFLLTRPLRPLRYKQGLNQEDNTSRSDSGIYQCD